MLKGEGMRNITTFSFKCLKKKCLGDQGEGWRIILIWALKWCERMEQIHIAHNRDQWQACENGRAVDIMYNWRGLMLWVTLFTQTCFNNSMAITMGIHINYTEQWHSAERATCVVHIKRSHANRMKASDKHGVICPNVSAATVTTNNTIALMYMNLYSENATQN